MFEFAVLCLGKLIVVSFLSLLFGILSLAILAFIIFFIVVVVAIWNGYEEQKDLNERFRSGRNGK